MNRIATLALLAAAATASADPKPTTKPELDQRFVAMIAKAAKQYRDWGYVDYRPNLAPMMCAAPRPGDYGRKPEPRMSADGPHGQKLYYLFASDRRSYLRRAELPVGFAIVKQSWTTKPAVEPAPPGGARREDFKTPTTTFHTADGWLETDAQKDLFVVAKVGDVAGADAGWIYGTVTAGGTVTSAGKVASCIGCHEDATYERLFGAIDDPTIDRRR